MQYRLSDLLHDDIIPGIRRLSGEMDFDAVGISFISVQERSGMDDFVREGELILSTADGCLNREASFCALLQSVKTAGGAALLLAIRDEGYRVPASVIACADALGLPLFRIPWERRFSDIQKAVAERIYEKKISAYTALRTALLNSFFESGTLSDAARAIGQALVCAVTIEDASGQTLAAHADAAACSASGECFSVLSGEALTGRLRLFGAVPEAGAIDREALIRTHLCFPLSLWFLQKDIEANTALRLKNDFVWNLADQNYFSLVEMEKQGARLHFDLMRPYCCALLRALPIDGQENFAEYSAGVSLVSTRIEQFLIRAGKRSGRGAMVASRNMDFIVYLAVPKTNAAATIEAFIDELHAGLAAAFPDYHFRFGLSEIAQTAPDFSQLYQDAAAALQWCLHTNLRRYRFTHQDTKEAQILSVLTRDESIRRMAETLLDPLAAYDATSDTDLIGTLSVFLRCNCNQSLTARTLHLHRQSLLYRLKKIEELTAMPLDHRQNIFLFDICLRILSRG